MNTMSKQPFKLIEIPINKFYEEAIPHHQKIYETHKLTSRKLFSSGNVLQLNKEVKDKKRVVKQLKDLLYELDTLRTQVEDVDLDRFDDKTFSLRKIITSLIKDYYTVEKQAMQLTDNENSMNENLENESPMHGALPQIQLHTNLSEIKLQKEQDRLNNVTDLENDIQDLHGICVNLNEMVVEQSELVDQVETNVEETQVNVEKGLQHLITASRLKKASYPITGALLGSLVGGPLGMVAGFKIGGAAALGCGVVGYASGKFMQNCNDCEDVENAINESHINRQSELESTESQSDNGKENEKKEK